MSGPIENPISDEEERTLHRRLVERDPTAPTDLAQLFLEHLIAWLKSTNSTRIPEDFIINAAEDALIALSKNPATFQPARGMRLAAYLRMSAQGDLQNLLRREQRQTGISLEDVELSEDAGKYLIVNDDPLSTLECQEAVARVTQTIVEPAAQGLSAGEERALQLVLDGVRETSAYAEALGITDLPEKAQRATVKRVKDKLKQRLKREASGNGQST